MTDSDRNHARDAFSVGWALLTGAATLAPDDDQEAACGAFVTAMHAGDPEWSPRASCVLGEMMLERGDPDSAARYLQLALASSHADWKPKADLLDGLVRAARGDVAGAVAAYGRAIVSRHSTYCPNGWFNLGVLHQGRGEVVHAVDAFRQAMALNDVEFRAKASVNLGFMLFNQMGDVEGAREAYIQAVATGHPQQSVLARKNLEALEALARSQLGWRKVDDTTDLTRPHNGARGSVKRSYFRAKDNSK
jgi:Flp pilus assembly protein TadD